MDCNSIRRDVTPYDEFVQAVFPPDLMLPDERVVIAHPDSFVKDGRQVDYYRQMNYRSAALRARRPWYFCVSTVERQRTRQVKKKLEHVRTAFVLACDDIGTKSKPPRVKPSYILETSPGNFQYGYLIEPFDVSSPKGQAYYDACLYSLALAGHNDPGFRSATRLARLPGSLHKSGFVATLNYTNYGRFWKLPELMEQFAIPMERPRVMKALEPGEHATLKTVDDPIYRWLVDTGQVKGVNPGWVFIDCPWRHRHTGGEQGYSSTAYSPDGYGSAGAGFKCLHGHCSGRGLYEFQQWALGQMNTPKNYLTGGNEC